MDSDKSFTYVVKTNGSTKINPRNVNIDGSEDPFYRYQMRQLYVQVLGKGKMIKTALLNIDDVSKDLKVNPTHLTHFIGYEFEAVAKYDGKKSDREKASIAGDREAAELSIVLRKFINAIVLCPKCKLPETNLIVDKSGDVILSCRGCGEKSTITDKLKQKFKAFLQKNINAEKEKERGKEKEKEKEREEQEKVKEKEASAPKAAKKEKKKKVADDEEEGVDWAVDTSAEAARRRRQELLPENNLTNLVKSDPIEELKSFIEENPQGDIADMILKLKEKNKIPDSKIAALVFEVFFSDGSRPDVPKHEALLKKVITTETAQMGLIDCLEKLCREESLSKISARILKEFYDSDLAEEEVILKWYAKKSNKAKKFRAEIEPFINWLQSAEEESE